MLAVRGLTHDCRTGLPGCLYRLPPPTHCWRRRIKFPISAFVYFYSVKLVLISGVTQEQDVTQSFLTQRLNYNDQHREKCNDVQVSSVMCYCIEPDSHFICKMWKLPSFFVRNKTIGRGEIFIFISLVSLINTVETQLTSRNFYLFFSVFCFF